MEGAGLRIEQAAPPDAVIEPELALRLLRGWAIVRITARRGSRSGPRAEGVIAVAHRDGRRPDGASAGRQEAGQRHEAQPEQESRSDSTRGPPAGRRDRRAGDRVWPSPDLEHCG